MRAHPTPPVHQRQQPLGPSPHTATQQQLLQAHAAAATQGVRAALLLAPRVTQAQQEAAGQAQAAAQRLVVLVRVLVLVTARLPARSCLQPQQP